MNTIDFRFEDSRSAKLAMDTLLELGFRVKPLLRIHFDHGDLTSALEIAESCGGTLDLPREAAGRAMPVSERAAFDAAYQLHELEASASLPVPAHVVTEDLPEEYLHPAAASAAVPGAADTAGDAVKGGFDPSADDYDHLDPGVHL